ncbi:unnamed protein product [Debaryomyces tyrocola]|nr:unnamed protein product [Debaryomyces tyrocola]
MLARFIEFLEGNIF